MQQIQKDQIFMRALQNIRLIGRQSEPWLPNSRVSKTFYSGKMLEQMRRHCTRNIHHPKPSHLH